MIKIFIKNLYSVGFATLCSKSNSLPHKWGHAIAYVCTPLLVVASMEKFPPTPASEREEEDLQLQTYAKWYNWLWDSIYGEP